jgi:predicted N-formylglutamate amidohydrolase
VALLLTCEHASRRVPPQWRALFEGRDALLASHRGWDPGALRVARALARALDAPLIATAATRLLVDANRSPHNPRVFSELTCGLPRADRERLLARYHAPHRERVRAAIAANPGTTVHVGVHSFTPRLGRERRAFAVGLLYDPKRRRERLLALDWQTRLQAYLGRGQVRRNAPYRGDTDGLTTALRRELPEGRYLGLELELNQAVLAEAGPRRRLTALLTRTLTGALA